MTSDPGHPEGGGRWRDHQSAQSDRALNMHLAQLVRSPVCTDSLAALGRSFFLVFSLFHPAPILFWKL